jgi:hypothetical protein
MVSLAVEDAAFRVTELADWAVCVKTAGVV